MAHLMEATQGTNVDYVLSVYFSDIFRDGHLYMSRKTGMFEIREGDRRTLAPDCGYVFRTEHVLLQSCWAKLFRKSLTKESGLRFNTNVVCYKDFAFNLQYFYVWLIGMCLCHMMDIVMRASKAEILNTDSKT